MLKQFTISCMFLALLAACDVARTSGSLVNPARSLSDYEGLNQQQLRQIAAKGDTGAQFKLAQTLLAKGNIKSGFRLMCHAAKHNHIHAQNVLASLYQSGVNDAQFPITQDLSKAYMWYSVAQDANHPNARFSKEEIAKHMTLDQINEAFRLRKTWKATVCDEA